MSTEQNRETDGTVDSAAPPTRVVLVGSPTHVVLTWPSTRVILHWIVVGLMVALFLWVISKITGVILLLILSIFFAYLVSPLVDFLRRPRRIGRRPIVMPRWLAIGVAYLVILTGIIVGIIVVVPQLGKQFPEFADQARVYWKTLGNNAQLADEYFRSQRMPGPVIDQVNNAVARIAEKGSEGVSAILAAVVGGLSYLPWLILIPILSFFLLKDVESFRRSALQMLPRGRWRWRGDEFFQDVNSTLAAYTRAQLTACLFIGVVCGLGFSVLSLPGPLVMGFLAGLFEFVPLVGPLSIAIIAVLLALLHSGPLSALLILLFLGVLRVVHDYVIYPRLIGQGIHLHPLAVIFAILSGAELAGVAGIFLAIPIVAIVTVSYRHWLEHRGSGGFADLLEPEAAGSMLESGSKSLLHPQPETTPEEMARARPDLTTGELKMPLGE